MKDVPSIAVTTTMSLWALKQAFREVTINHENFDAGWWSIRDAENFEAAAAMIRREIAERSRAKEAGTS